MFVVSSNSEASKNKIRHLRIILILNALRKASHILRLSSKLGANKIFTYQSSIPYVGCKGRQPHLNV